jgi:hypothetical protein
LCKSKSGALYVYTQLFILEQIQDYMYCTYYFYVCVRLEGCVAQRNILDCQYHAGQNEHTFALDVQTVTCKYRVGTMRVRSD